MRALVVVAGTSPILGELTPRLPAALVPCVDRPILQHLVEYLVDRGITSFDFVLHESAREIEEFLGDGTRWGSRFVFHLVCDPCRPYEPLKLLPHDGQAILLVHADRLPILSPRPVLEQQSIPDTLFYVCMEHAPGTDIPRWTGAAILQTYVAACIPDGATQSELEQHLRKFAGEDAITTVELLDFRDFETLLASQRSILGKATGIAHLAAREVEPGTWIARNVIIHPTAELTPPVFIGENSRIGSGAKIGPNAVVGHDSIIDQHTEVIDSAVLPGSYCGEHLELDHVVVDRNRLVSSRLGTSVNITDTFILSALRAKGRKHWFRSLVSRSLATALFIFTLPIVLLTALVLWLARRSPLFYYRRVAQLPGDPASSQAKTFNLYSFRNPADRQPFTKLSWVLLDFLPALGQVVMGKLHLVGVCPRTQSEIDCLPEDWRALYLQGRAGLLTEAFVIHGPTATEDEIYSCEAYYIAAGGLGHDLSLALRFVTGPA